MNYPGFFLSHFQDPYGWYWMALAAVLFAAEAFLPGIFLMWFGLAAAITGAVVLLVPAMDVTWQVALLAASSVVCVGIGRQMWGSYRAPRSDRPNLNERGQQYVGQTFELTEAIRNGCGRVAVGDSTWLAKGPEMPAGTRVRVKAVDGTVLLVERA